MKGSRLLVVAAVAVAAIGTPAAADPRAVVELFTSQGCSSCPPADKLLGELARDPALVAMSLPIDYWDYIGWKDTLARPRHTARQRGYAKTRGDGEIYTPQVVINGVARAVGSEKGEIERAIVQSRNNAAILSVPVKVAAADGKLTVSIAPQTEAKGNLLASLDGAKGEVWLCALSKAVLVAIGRGENRGRTVTYHNVVRRWVKLGDWNGSARTFSVPASDVDADTVAVIVQSGTVDHPGAMLGAALASVR
ncbi:MAG TPA: DUF1223 domain-containing protein [Xanthobacteraceae bacterium]|nr:DUF1223 domain-containing protein [Xanthobacteraceae bacterium]